MIYQNLKREAAVTLYFREKAQISKIPNAYLILVSIMSSEWLARTLIESRLAKTVIRSLLEAFDLKPASNLTQSLSLIHAFIT